MWMDNSSCWHRRVGGDGKISPSTAATAAEMSIELLSFIMRWLYRHPIRCKLIWTAGKKEKKDICRWKWHVLYDSWENKPILWSSPCYVIWRGTPLFFKRFFAKFTKRRPGGLWMHCSSWFFGWSDSVLRYFHVLITIMWWTVWIGAFNRKFGIFLVNPALF